VLSKLWWFRLPRRDSASTIAAASVILVSGCVAGYMVDPDRTTYPRESIRRRQVSMPILDRNVGVGVGVEAGDSFSHESVIAGRPFLEFEKTMIGDSAVHEVRILPKAAGARNKTSLLAGAPDVARRICGQRYRITRAQYYNGTEATSRFLGIAHPWLKVVIRCPVDVQTKDDPAAELVVSVSKAVPEADYFDVHEKDYPVGVTQLHEVVEKVLAKRGMLIKRNFRSSDMDVIITDRHRTGIVGFPVYEQLIAVLAKKEKGSLLAVRLLAHDRDFEGRSDATGSLRLTPGRRNFAYRRVQSFLGEIAKGLESQ